MQQTMSTSSSTREITTLAELQALAPQWERLWLRDLNATPFQSPQWLIPWARHIAEGDLRTIAIGSERQLEALIPLYVYSEPRSRRRRLFLLGIGTSDYLDGIFAGDRQYCLRQFCGDWDECDFQQLRPASPLLQCGDERSAGEPCPVLDLRDWPRAVPHQMLHNVHYYRTRAGRAGMLRFETADAQTVDEILDALIDLHRARWNSKDASGVLCDPRVVRAHRESIPLMIHAGMLRLHALRMDGRIIAAAYCFIDPPREDRRAYYYLGGFDPACEKISPGTILIAHAIDEARGEGAIAFDFLRGRERYKYLWGAIDSPTYRLRSGGSR
jgi:CelD/BcsL family acetyltransferase involved in cellulose biosynthesis